MDPEISEFSFGYAVTEAFANRWRPDLAAAPLFPSLVQEGQPGGGYDVLINRRGIPLFLQFKLSHRMVRGTASEVKQGIFQVPFYRMHLYPLRKSDQHLLLCDLEQGGNIVRYVAPMFHAADEFNDAYLTSRVLQRSVFISPLAIGPLPDDGYHHVAFQDRSRWRVLSDDPSDRDAPIDDEQFDIDLRHAFAERSQTALSTEALAQLAAKMVSILEIRQSDRLTRPRRRQRPPKEIHVSQILTIQNPLQRVAYLARTFFGCECLAIIRD